MKVQNISVTETLNIIKIRGFANTEETSLYLSLSINYVRRLAREKQLPSTKPSGKCIYFKIEDLDNYLMNNKRISNKKIMEKATKYLFSNK
ncbi:helix-turn-helix domain-containing protein [Flavobacterium psychrophilum]|uniref:helix-turn-helix domain-containing protein n=1 Tax=Flavobacterium psychrophilum TaxID=96345 RepID=UPI001D07A781|nr:helix-turn-helix domain-containing protein [Flavobacterium psychrophilum]MCB6098451.1 helix-turn-helix domain-containing protein [Flavobacterium psychrophilum]